MSALPQTRFIAWPLLPIAGAVCIGIIIGQLLLNLSGKWLLGSIGLSAITAAAGTLAVLTGRLRTSSVALLLAFIFTGISLSISHDRSRSANRLATLYEQANIASDDPVELTGVIYGEPEPAPQGVYLTIVLERLRYKQDVWEISGTVLLLGHVPAREIQQEFEGLELHHGTRIRVMTALARENYFQNPGVTPFTEYLDRQGYDATGTIKSPWLVEHLGDVSVFRPLAWLYEWRAHLQSEFNRRFSADTAGVLNAALLGNPHGIAAGTAERFRAGGTFHLLVISGMQIAFIAGVATLMVRRLSSRRWLQFVLATAFLWAYTIGVGAQPSVVRAALMFTFVAFAPLVGRQSNSLNAIAAAGLVLLIYNPSNLFDPSFQLTFLSVLAIICLALPLLRQMQRVGSWQPTNATPYPPNCPSWFRKLSEALFWSERTWQTEMANSNIRYRLFKTPLAATGERWKIQRPLRFVLAAVIVSASIQLGLLPLMILYFHRVSIASLFLNIFVGLLMAVLSLAAIASVLIAQFSPSVAVPLIGLAEGTNWLMIHSVDPFTRLGAASLRLPHYGGWSSAIYVLYFGLLSLLVIALLRWNPLHKSSPPSRGQKVGKHGTRITAAAFLLVLTIAIIHPRSVAGPDGKLRIDFLDVGQGDSALVTTPAGTTLLIDGGGRPNIDWQTEEGERSFQRDTLGIGERVVSEYLWSRGLDHIDFVIATHADADHIDGLSDVVRNFKVRGAIVARMPANDPGFARFAASLAAARVPIETVAAGDAMQIGDVVIDVLWPSSIQETNAPYRNNDGLVLRLTYGNRAFLFAADVEKESESALVQSGHNLRCDVIKVAHHGSRTSSTPSFVNATRPRIAIISVGRTSIFGHPHQEVIERWQASGARVMTTGEKGMISLTTDGTNLGVSTFVP